MIEGELYMTPVIIAGIENEQENFDYTMAELASLAEAANMEVTRQFKKHWSFFRSPGDSIRA